MTRGVLVGVALLLATGTACGKYGPPERAPRPRPPATAPAPAAAPAPAPAAPSGDFDEGEAP